MFKYLPHTEQDIQEMLKKIGITDINSLFTDIPLQARWTKEYQLPKSKSEIEVRQTIEETLDKNESLLCFRGGGAYDIYVPSVIKALTSRQEFLTSYTPYQPEISQGTLQYIFEFQSMICELTGMDVANASMYDGATAAAEAMFMAASATGRKKILVSGTVNPNTISVLKTYAKFRGLQIEMIPEFNHVLDYNDTYRAIDDEVACLIAQNPNFYGFSGTYDGINKLLKAHGALFIMIADPSTLALLKAPSEFGADIVCGDGQTLGLDLSYGGPYVGFLATTKEYLRKMPGRICGMTKDVDGKRGFVLTLQAREQHIRRSKANSNICSNQSLMALTNVIYMSIMGKKGLMDVASRAFQNAHYLEQKLVDTGLFTRVCKGVFFKEFTLQYTKDAHKLDDALVKKGFLGGIVLKDNKMIFCATEKRTKKEIDLFVDTIVGESHGI